MFERIVGFLTDFLLVCGLVALIVLLVGFCIWAIGTVLRAWGMMFLTRRKAKKLNSVELFDAWDKVAVMVEMAASECERNGHYEKADELIKGLEIARKAVEKVMKEGSNTKMSKSILVIDTPKKCDGCMLHGMIIGKQICLAELKRVKNESGKPGWCPLKVLPEKKDDTGISSYSCGFNNCIDEILKGVNENG